MKRRQAKIGLHRESLYLLDPRHLEAAAAGATMSQKVACPLSFTCVITGCPSLCVKICG